MTLGAINMNRHFAMWLLLAAGMALTACETGPSRRVLEKNAQGSELQNETKPVGTLPDGCPTLPTPLPAGKTRITVSYQEPTTNQNGVPLTELLYTTIYLSSLERAQAIHVWTNDAHGGAFVTIRDIAVPAQELKLCVTATNWNRKESRPTVPTQLKP
jgi:hypothetical protein